jgi:hypothetical protein
MKVFAVRRRTNSPWRACANFIRYVSSRSRGTFEVRARRGESLFGKQPLGLKRCEDASHSQLRKLSRGRTFPHTGGQAVRNGMDTFCPIGVISVIRG